LQQFQAQDWVIEDVKGRIPLPRSGDGSFVIPALGAIEPALAVRRQKSVNLLSKVMRQPLEDGRITIPTNP
jgi:hypothetical protein